MKQFFLFGASTVYGVGSEDGGWGELLKSYLHQQMYRENGLGETYEVFNFAKSGATVQFVLDTFVNHLKNYGRGDEVVSIVSIGGNDSRAKGTPDNYVSTVEDYIQQITTLINLLKQHSNQVLVVGNGYVDESKTSPKISPFDGSKSYFTNARREEFQLALKDLCNSLGVRFIEIPGSIEDWQSKYLFADGLHPNNEGHRLIFEAVRDEISI